MIHKKIIPLFLICCLLFAKGVFAEQRAFVTESELRIADFTSEFKDGQLTVSFVLSGDAEDCEKALAKLPSYDGTRECAPIAFNKTFPEAGLTAQDRILYTQLVSSQNLIGDFDLRLNSTSRNTSAPIFRSNNFRITFSSPETIEFLKEQGSIFDKIENTAWLTKEKISFRLEEIESALNRIQFKFAEEVDFMDADISSPEEAVSFFLNGIISSGIGVAPYSAFSEIEIPEDGKTRSIQYAASDVTGINPYTLYSGEIESASLRFLVLNPRIQVVFLDANGFERIWLSEPITDSFTVEFPIPDEKLQKTF